MDIDLVEENTDVDLQELMAVPRRDEKLEIEETSRRIMAVLSSLGANAARYRRERTKLIRAVVSEIFSPPRVTAATKLHPELSIIPGFALDFDNSRQRWSAMGLSQQSHERASS